MDWKLELVTIPVSDVDRAKAFYVERAGFVADHDHVVQEGLRFVQLTPPGSACSIAIGDGLTDVTPGSAQAQLVVADIGTARDELRSRGVDVGDVQTFRGGRSSSSQTRTATAGRCSSYLRGDDRGAAEVALTRVVTISAIHSAAGAQVRQRPAEPWVCPRKRWIVVGTPAS
jgi:catechol 2,3-dioxygenase-like lactoylglutathione lyase family enzyme